MKAVTTIAALLIAFSINVTAQVKGIKNYTPRNQPQNVPQYNNNSQGSHSGWGQGGSFGNVTIGFNTYPNYYAYNNCNSYNGYSLRKTTRYSLGAAGQLINQAVAFDSWNDIYSPILAKAIRHYNYAQQLYWWGNYQAAHNHAERARYLASYSLQYFQSPGCGGNYGGAYEPNPYSDPNNPYYRTDQTDNSQNGSGQGNKTAGAPNSDGIDQKLPGSGINDKELIRNFNKTELKDE
jgi:hypothetical protein